MQAAVKKAAVARLDADLKAKTITQAQYDEAVEHLNEHIARLGDAKFGPGGKGGGPAANAPPAPRPRPPPPRTLAIPGARPREPKEGQALFRFAGASH